MEAIRIFETSVDIQLRTRHYIPEDFIIESNFTLIILSFSSYILKYNGLWGKAVIQAVPVANTMRESCSTYVCFFNG